MSISSILFLAFEWPKVFFEIICFDILCADTLSVWFNELFYECCCPCKSTTRNDSLFIWYLDIWILIDIPKVIKYELWQLGYFLHSLKPMTSLTLSQSSIILYFEICIFLIPTMAHIQLGPIPSGFFKPWLYLTLPKIRVKFVFNKWDSTEWAEYLSDLKR